MSVKKAYDMCTYRRLWASSVYMTINTTKLPPPAAAAGRVHGADEVTVWNRRSKPM